MVKIFEMLQRGEERLTNEEKIHFLATKFKNLTFEEVEFVWGSTYTNPIHLASALTDGSYVLFIEEPKKGVLNARVLSANAEIRNWLRSHRENTSYGAIEEYLGRH